MPFRPVRGATFLWIDDLCRGLMLDHIIAVIGSLADSRVRFLCDKVTPGGHAAYGKKGVPLFRCGIAAAGEPLIREDQATLDHSM